VYDIKYPESGSKTLIFNTKTNKYQILDNPVTESGITDQNNDLEYFPLSVTSLKKNIST
jgi:hypothetical protein